MGSRRAIRLPIRQILHTLQRDSLSPTFKVNGKPLLIFIGIQNATNRRNIAQASWDRTLNQVRFNRQLDLFFLIGLDWNFDLEVLTLN